MPTGSSAKDNAAEPVRVLPAMRALLSGIPPTPIPAQVEFASEQIMLGGRPLQDVVAGLYGDGGDWTVRQLEFRAPGHDEGVAERRERAKRFARSISRPRSASNSSDPDALMTWLQGRSDLAYRSQKPLRLRGDVSVAPDSFAIDGMKAEIDGGTVEGRIAVSHPQPSGGARIDADLKAERLDLDAASGFRALAGGPAGRMAGGGAAIARCRPRHLLGQELRPLVATLGYGPKTISLDRLKIGQPDGVTMEGVGRFDRANATGKLALNSSAASFNQLTALIAPFAPSLACAAQCDGNGPRSRARQNSPRSRQERGQADRANARVVLDLDAPQLKGVTTLTAKPPIAAINGIDIEAIKRSEVAVDAKLSSGQGRSLLALLGLDRAIAAGEGAAQFEGSANGAWGAPLRLKAKISGTGLDAEAQGTAEPWAQEPKASCQLEGSAASIWRRCSISSRRQARATYRADRRG